MAHTRTHRCLRDGSVEAIEQVNLLQQTQFHNSIVVVVVVVVVVVLVVVVAVSHEKWFPLMIVAWCFCRPPSPS